MKVSVIVPAYQAARVIGRCVRSVRRQSYPNWELLVVDDGSCDGTAAAVRTAAGRDARVRLIKTGHRGVSFARNRGMAAACGEVVLFLDADDVLLTCCLGEAVRAFRENPDAQIVEFGSVDYGAAVRRSAVGRRERICFSRDEALREMLAGKTMRHVVCGCAYRKDALAGHWFDEGLHIGEDCCFHVDVCMDADRTVLVQEPLYVIYPETGSVTRKALNGRDLKSVLAAHAFLWKRMSAVSGIRSALDNFLFDEKMGYFNRALLEGGYRRYGSAIKELEYSIVTLLRQGYVTSKKRFAYRLYRQNSGRYVCLIKGYYRWRRIDRKWYGTTGFRDRCGV